MKLKLEEEYWHLKFYLCVTDHESRFILRFLLILLVSILFSVSNSFLLLQIIQVYNKEKKIECSLRQW